MEFLMFKLKIENELGKPQPNRQGLKLAWTRIALHWQGGINFLCIPFSVCRGRYHGLGPVPMGKLVQFMDSYFSKKGSHGHVIVEQSDSLLPLGFPGMSLRAIPTRRFEQSSSSDFFWPLHPTGRSIWSAPVFFRQWISSKLNI